jgi:hypothetical protein
MKNSYLFLIICNFLLSTYASGATDYFEIVEKKGKVTVRTTMSAYTRDAVEGRKFRLGAILNVEENSSVKIMVHNKRKFMGAKSDQFVFNFLKPIVFRIDKETLRRIRNKNFHLSSAKSILSAILKADTINTGVSMKDAFNRSSAVMNSQELGKAFDILQDIKKISNRGVETEKRVNKIVIYQPEPATIHAVNNFPVTSKMIWKRPKKYHGKFHIYQWLEHDRRIVPVAVTMDTEISLKFFTEGTYFLQIVSEDERYQSEPMTYKAYYSDSLISLGLGALAKKKDLEEIEILSPPNNMVIHTDNKSAQVVFNARCTEIYLNGKTRVLIAKESSLKDSKILKSKSKTFYTKLTPGVYKWLVACVADGKVVAKSKFYDLQVVADKSFESSKHGLNAIVTDFLKKDDSKDSTIILQNL